MQLSTLFLFISLLQQTTEELTPEQVATDYFFENIFEQDFPEYRVIEFNTLTDINGSFGIVLSCDNLQTLFKELEQETTGTPITVNANKCPIKVKRTRSNSKRLRIDVKSRREVSERTFVYLTAYQRFRFVQHYILTLNKEGTEVLDYCSVPEVI